MESKEVENLLEAYRGELSSLDMDLPSFYLEDKSAASEKARAIDAEIVQTSDLSDEIDRLWAEIEHRRFGPDPGRRIWNISAAVLAGVAISSLAVFVYKMPETRPPASRETAHGAETQTIPFPADHPASLAIAHGAFLSVDTGTNELIILDPGSAQIVRTAAFPNASASGISAGEHGLWSTDADGSWIYRHDPTTYAIVEKFSSPGSRPSSVIWDGNSLWTTDARTSKLYRHASEKGLRVLASREIADAEPAGIARAGDFIWVAGKNSQTIRRYRIGSGLKEAGSAHFGDLLPAGSRLTGFTVEGDWAWFLTDGPPELHRIARSRIRFGS